MALDRNQCKRNMLKRDVQGSEQIMKASQAKDLGQTKNYTNKTIKGEEIIQTS